MPQTPTRFLPTVDLSPHPRSDFSGGLEPPVPLVDTGDAPAIDTGSEANAALLRLAMGFKISAAMMMAVSMTYMNA